MEQVYDIFISYSRKDYLDENLNIIPGNVVSTIKDTLTKEGFSFWFDEEGIYSGQNFIEKIVNNIESSKLFLYLSTANANASKWTCKEIASANEFGKPIIPVRIDRSPYNKKVMFLISDLDYIEYYNNPEIGLRDMVLSIRAHLQSLKEEEERKKKEEEARHEAEIKRLEEERRKKEEEERRRQEEQIRIVSDIEFACAKLNTEEKKLDLDRGALLVDAERVSDSERRERLKSFITSSSPIRQRISEEIKKLRDQIAKLEANIIAVKTEKEHLETQLEETPETPAYSKGSRWKHWPWWLGLLIMLTTTYWYIQGYINDEWTFFIGGACCTEILLLAAIALRAWLVSKKRTDFAFKDAFRQGFQSQWTYHALFLLLAVVVSCTCNIVFDLNRYNSQPLYLSWKLVLSPIYEELVFRFLPFLIASLPLVYFGKKPWLKVLKVVLTLLSGCFIIMAQTSYIEDWAVLKPYGRGEIYAIIYAIVLYIAYQLGLHKWEGRKTKALFYAHAMAYLSSFAVNLLTNFAMTV